MKKIDLGQTITIFANLGVIAGIVLLAIELNQNNSLLRNEARYNLHLARTEEIEQLALNQQLGDIWSRAGDGESLTADEMRVMNALALARFVRWEWYYEQFRSGLIDEEVLPVAAWRRIFADNPSVIEIWHRNSELLTPEFVLFMEDDVVPR